MIDKRGRLFGFINIIDLLVILFVIAMLVVGVKRLKSAPSASSDTSKVKMTLDISDIRKMAVDAIKEGDAIYDYDKGTYIGKIVNKKVEDYKKEVEYQGKVVKADVPDKYQVYIEVECDAKESDEYYLIGGMQVRVGTQVRIKNKNFTTFAFCVGIEKI